jgi:hypothetical protein
VRLHWNQIESSDYPTYVANLRSIGCPEQTIRDIITADVHATFAPRRAQLEAAQLADSRSGKAGGGPSQSAAAAGLAGLQTEEAKVVETLLGPTSTTGEAVGGQSALALTGRQPRPNNRQIVMPLVWQDVDLDSLNLDQDRLQTIRELKQGFLDDIGGPDQDPTDPAYRERWLKAQAETDELLRGFIGLRAYQQYELEASGPTAESAAAGQNP